MIPYATGAITSRPDSRDYEVARFNGPAAALQLAPAWSFAGLLQPVRNQGGEGTCVGHALTTVMGYQQATAAPAGQQPDREILSPRDAYEGARMLEPVPGGGDGAYPRAALKYAQRQGVCREDYWPYVERVRGNPRGEAGASRYANRVLTYSRVPGDVQALKEAMYWHGPIMASIPVDQRFAACGADGVISSGGLALGGHAITLAGWDDARRAFRIRNSWGTTWGDRGDAWLPYWWPITEAWCCTPALDAPPPTIPWWSHLIPWWNP